MKKMNKISVALISSLFIFTGGFFISCSDDSGDEAEAVSNSSEPSHSDPGSSEPISEPAENPASENGNNNQDSVTEKNLPIIPQGANYTKIEGAGIWIYLDNSELKISGANSKDFIANTSVTLTDSKDDSPVEVKSFEFNDYGPDESSLRLMVLMNDASCNTLKAKVSISANGIKYQGTAEFKNGAYKFDFEPEELIISTESNTLQIPQGKSVGLLVSDNVYKMDITEDCTFTVEGEGLSINGNKLTVSSEAPEAAVKVTATHKSGKSQTLSLEIVSAGTKIGINWKSINWLVNGSGEKKNTDKYKINAKVKEVVNIQKPGWDGVKEPGIFLVTNAEISSCTLGTGTNKEDFYIEGAGILLYLSSFTQKETSFTITDAEGTYDVTVYFEDGRE